MLVLGATSSIAMATMRLYAQARRTVYLVARSEEKLALVAADLQVRGAAAVHTCVMDLDTTRSTTLRFCRMRMKSCKGSTSR